MGLVLVSIITCHPRTKFRQGISTRRSWDNNLSPSYKVSSGNLRMRVTGPVVHRY